MVKVAAERVEDAISLQTDKMAESEGFF